MALRMMVYPSFSYSAAAARYLDTGSTEGPDDVHEGAMRGMPSEVVLKLAVEDAAREWDASMPKEARAARATPAEVRDSIFGGEREMGEVVMPVPDRSGRSATNFTATDDKKLPMDERNCRRSR